MTAASDPQSLRRRALQWYDANARALPWRRPPGAQGRVDPYRVWLSEIMLQQTTVPHATPYFQRFTETWPSVEALAAADREAVMAAWAGLGYYSRARNLHACARDVAALGGFPDTLAGLKALPGIGEYTAAAIAAIAFDRAVVPLDGNIERVVARLFALDAPLPRAKPAFRKAAQVFAAEERPGDLAQALMDLGAQICTPKSPSCGLCPLREGCAAYSEGRPEAYPVKAAKKDRPTRSGVAFWLTKGRSVLLRRQPDKGLLGGMWLPPSTPWETGGWSEAEALSHAPAAAEWEGLNGEVRHVFTHFALTLSIWRAEAPDGFAPGEAERFVALRDLDQAGLPSVGKKVWKLAQIETGRGPS